MQLYPKVLKPVSIPKSVTNRKWIVEYHMVYDGGTSHWLQWYRIKLWARFMGWWTYHISTRGGTVKLYPNEWRGELPPGWTDPDAGP